MAEEIITAPKTSDSNLMGAISYLWLLSIVMLLVKKDDAFVQFHAKQGVVLFVASMILWFIPIIGWLANILVFVAVIVGAIKAYQGEKYEMPLVSELAKKINL